MRDDGDLPLEDRIALGQLAYLRQRSLSSSRYRSVGQVWLCVTPRSFFWSRPSVLDPQLEAVRRSLTTFERLAKRNSPEAGDAWRDVLDAVDQVLAEGARRLGRRIRPRRI